jgi:S-adenosylmethionine:tRNA ribosyltransferase-isomerase
MTDDLDPSLRLSSYDYDLPRELIAQAPLEPRDAARLLVLHRDTGAIDHRFIRDLPDLLDPGDLIVANRSRVLQARLTGHKAPSGGQIEMTLLRPLENGAWEALMKGHRLQAGQLIELDNGTRAEIGEPTAGGREVRFPGIDVYGLLEEAGHTPLPPYIHGYQGAPSRYQTVYADDLGSAAAPTAGLHFTPELIDRLRERGIGWASVVLHIGLDTFKPITDEDVRQRHIHTEWVDVSSEVVQAVQAARAAGRRVVAVGTSSVRSLEFAAQPAGLHPYQGPVDLFVVPGHEFRDVDALMTNFHMPRTSVLLLVAAFAGRERVLSAYEAAKREGYRFLSFGDGMLIL